MSTRKKHTVNTRRRVFLRLMRRLFFLAVVMILSGCLPDFLKDDKTEVATILQRKMYDRSADSLRTLMETNDKTVTFFCDRIERLLEKTEGGISIDDALDREIVASYPERIYAVKVRLCIERTTKQYFVDRNKFNLLRVGVITKFVMNSKETAIDSLIAY